MLIKSIPIYRPVNIILCAIVFGAVLGFCAVNGWKISNAVEVFMSQLGLFAVVPFLFGYASPNKKIAAISAALLLVSMSLVYYIPYAPSLPIYLIQAAVWTVLSFIAGPVLGIVGHAARGENKKAAVALSLLVGILLGEAVRMFQVGYSQGDLSELYLTLVFNVSAATLLLVQTKPQWRKRVMAYSLVFSALGYVITAILR